MTLLAQILNFLILVIILRAVAYKPICNMLKARQDKIAEAIEKADADEAEAAKKLSDCKAELSAAQTKAAEILSNAERQAAEERENAIKEVKLEIEQMKKKAEEDIARDREKAMSEMRSEVAAIAMAAAGKIISKNMDSKENEQLIGDFIDKLDKQKIGDLSC